MHIDKVRVISILKGHSYNASSQDKMIEEQINKNLVIHEEGRHFRATKVTINDINNGSFIIITYEEFYR